MDTGMRILTHAVVQAEGSAHGKYQEVLAG